MHAHKTFLSLTAAALCAAAVAPAAASAGSDYERGGYSGKTSQPASDGAKTYAGSFKVSLGILSDPPRVTRVELAARLRCADGSTRVERYGKVIAFGPQLNRKGRFTYTDGGLKVKGKFGKQGKARGTFSYAVGDCSIAGVGWKAKD